MNRILKIFKDQLGRNIISEPMQQARGLPPTARPKDAPGDCAFCGKSLKGCLFTAWTMAGIQPAAAICINCIRSYSVASRFTETFGIWFETIPDYGPLKRSLMKRLSYEDGTEELKTVIANVGIRLLQRNSAILGGCVLEHCPKTGANLALLPRMAIITDQLNACAELLRIVCSEIGIVYRRVTMSQLRNGFAYRQLVEEQCSGQETWAAHAVLCCPGYSKSCPNTAVVWLALTSTGIPDEVEKILIDRRKS